MSEEEIIGNINWAIYVNKMTKSINGDNTHISVNVLQGLLDLYNKEKEKNKKLFEEYNKRVATIIKYEQEIKEIIDKIDAEDYYCLNEAEEDLRKLVE